METTERADLATEGVGYLDMREYNRARWAYEQSHPTSAFMRWLLEAGNVSFSVDDGGAAPSSEPTIPIPATKLAHDEIARISLELNKWPGVDEAAHDKFGASLLIDLGREVSTAMHKWPMEDKPRRIQELMCGECEQFTLTVRPPRWEGDHSIVTCTCGYRMTMEEFEQLVDMFKKEDDDRKRKAVADARRSRRKSA